MADSMEPQLPVGANSPVGNNKRPREEDQQPPSSARRRYERLEDMYTTLVEESRVKGQQLIDKDAECCILASNYQQSQIKIEQLERENARLRMYPDAAAAAETHNKTTEDRYEELSKHYKVKRQCNARLHAQILTFRREWAVQRKRRKEVEEEVTRLRNRIGDETHHQQQYDNKAQYYQRQLEETQYQLESTKLILQNVYRELAAKNRLLRADHDGRSREEQHSDSDTVRAVCAGHLENVSLMMMADSRNS